MTVISSDGRGTEQVGQSVASQLATSTQLIKDLVGIDIAELVTGRATGAAAGEAIASATDETSGARRRSGAPRVGGQSGAE